MQHKCSAGFQGCKTPDKWRVDIHPRCLLSSMETNLSEFLFEYIFAQNSK